VTEIRSPVDDIPIEIRRANWGWFGEPWPSGVCYDDDGRLIEEMRKPFPAGETCLYCTELFADGDSGQAMPCGRADGASEIRHVHKECMLREVLGSMAHLEHRCRCYGGTDHDRSHADALAVWEWVQRHGK
jgi:hypothetical protein